MVEREDLDRAVGFLKDHINDKFKAFQRYDEEVHSNIRATLKLHSNSLYGNGNTGLVKQVDRMQTSYKTVKKMVAGFSVLMSSFLAYLGFK